MRVHLWERPLFRELLLYSTCISPWLLDYLPLTARYVAQAFCHFSLCGSLQKVLFVNLKFTVGHLVVVPAIIVVDVV